MNDWDAELHYAQEQELKFFRQGAWAPYLEVRKWRRRFWLAMLAIGILLAVMIARGCA